MELIRKHQYTLIMDETLDIACDFNCVASVQRDVRQSNSKKDYAALIGNGTITVDNDTGLVTWTGGSWVGGKFEELEKYVRQGRVYYARESTMICVYPPEMFAAFTEIYLMTYGFEASFVCPYFHRFGIACRKASLILTDGRYELTVFSREADIAFRESIGGMITIRGGRGEYEKTALSKNWYAKAYENGGTELRALRNKTAYFFDEIAGAKASRDEIMWACPKVRLPSGSETICLENIMKGKGYTCVRRLTKEDLSLPGEDLEKLKKELSCFVPSNCRATNMYSSRWALAYLTNLYIPPVLTGFFRDYPDESVCAFEDAMAVSTLVQWIMRSRLRNNQPVVLYLPSARMESLLREWLGGGIL